MLGFIKRLTIEMFTIRYEGGLDLVKYVMCYINLAILLIVGLFLLAYTNFVVLILLPTVVWILVSILELKNNENKLK